jgi:hypothetical protein
VICDAIGSGPRTVGALAAASFVTSDSSGPEALLTSWQPTIM